MNPAPSKDHPIQRRILFTLLAVGLCLELCLLWWNRLSIDDAITHPIARRAIEAPFTLAEAVLGPVRTDRPGTGERVKIAHFVWGYACAFFFYGLGCWLVLSQVERDHPRVLAGIVAGAALFRLTLVPYPPILETDIHRYVWDGAVSASHVNPYQFAPVEISKLSTPGHRDLYTPPELARMEVLERLLASPDIKAHFDRINHPKIPTIYPPLAQVVFSLAHRIWPGSAGTLKLLVALVDLAIVGVIVALLGLLGMNRLQVVLYAWCPLVLKEYANTGHYDPLATLLVLTALYLLVRRRAIVASIALGLGVLAKIYPLAIALLLWRRLGILGLAALIATIGLGYWQHLSIGRQAFDGFVAFATDWEFNASLFPVVDRTIESIAGKGVVLKAALVRADGTGPIVSIQELRLDSFQLAKIVCGVVGLLLVLVLSAGDVESPESLVGRTFAVMAALILLGPVANPWYVGWLLPFVSLIPSGSWIYLSATIVSHYLYFWNWRFPSWQPATAGARALGTLFPTGPLQAAEYGPFFLLLLFEQRRRLASLVRSVGTAARWLGRRLREEAGGAASPSV